MDYDFEEHATLKVSSKQQSLGFLSWDQKKKLDDII